MSLRKILIIAYYWPPSGGSGVQRWLKFVKYLPGYGFQPFVFTPENPSMVQLDESLLQDVPMQAEVIRFPIWEPYNLFFKVSGKKGKPSSIMSSGKKSFFHSLSNWIRGNFFIPDPKIFWVKPSVKFLHDFLIENDIKTVITTGPPHSMHLIGLKLKKKNPSLNWIADFRDPWSEWPFLKSFQLTSIVQSIHKKQERRVLQNADYVLTITPFYKNRFERLSSREVKLITNGFDEEDFKMVNPQKEEKFVIRHVGIVYAMSNPKILIDGFHRIVNSNSRFKSDCVLEFVGEVNQDFKSQLLNSDLKDIVRFRDPVPHKELMSLYSSSAMLLLNIEGYEHAEGLLPGKVFEYLATRLPVLGIGPTKSDLAELLIETNSGMMFNLQNIDAMSEFVLKYYKSWTNGEVGINSSEYKKYSRRELTGDLAKLLI